MPLCERHPAYLSFILQIITTRAPLYICEGHPDEGLLRNPYRIITTLAPLRGHLLRDAEDTYIASITTHAPLRGASQHESAGKLSGGNYNSRPSVRGIDQWLETRHPCG